MQDFMPWHGLAGGLLIGLASALFLLLSGRISGISGILENSLQPTDRAFAWSIAYLSGLPLGCLLVVWLAPQLSPRFSMTLAWPLVAAGGLLVGLGTRMAGGCTSGHGVCGLPRLSARSFVAVGVFMAVAALTVFVARHVI